MDSACRHCAINARAVLPHFWPMAGGWACTWVGHTVVGPTWAEAWDVMVHSAGEGR